MSRSKRCHLHRASFRGTRTDCPQACDTGATVRVIHTVAGFDESAAGCAHTHRPHIARFPHLRPQCLRRDRLAATAGATRSPTCCGGIRRRAGGKSVGLCQWNALAGDPPHCPLLSAHWAGGTALTWGSGDEWVGWVGGEGCTHTARHHRSVRRQGRQS